MVTKIVLTLCFLSLIATPCYGGLAGSIGEKAAGSAAFAQIPDCINFGRNAQNLLKQDKTQIDNKAAHCLCNQVIILGLDILEKSEPYEKCKDSCETCKQKEKKICDVLNEGDGSKGTFAEMEPKIKQAAEKKKDEAKKFCEGCGKCLAKFASEANKKCKERSGQEKSTIDGIKSKCKV